MLNKLSQYSKNILTLITGTVISQGIAIALSPVITRLYTPDEMGVFALYISIAGILGVIASGRFELAVMFPKKDEDAISLIRLAIIISLAFCSLIFLIVLLFNSGITKLLNVEEISPFLYIIPLSIFLMSILNSFTIWRNRKDQFKRISVSQIVQTSTSSTTTVGFGIFNSGPFGLIMGQLMGLVGANSLLIFVKNLFKIKRWELKKSFKEYSDFPLKNGFSSIFNLLANQLPMMLIGVLFGLEVLGLYSLVIRVLNLPLTVIGKSVSQAFFKRSNELSNNTKDLKKLLFKTSLSLFSIIVIPMIVLFLWGDGLFSFIFGNEWEEAGKIASIFSLFYIIRFIVYSQSTLLIVKRKLSVDLIINSVFFLSQMISLYYGYYSNDYMTSFLLMSITGAVVYLFFGFYIFRFATKTENSN